MEKRMLGNTGIEVTELCLGVLPIGPLQKNVPIEEAAEVILYGLESGINFLDTAQMYKTYPHIKKALEKTNIKPVIASKSTASSYEEMEEAILEALEMMGLNHIDIFHLHAAKVDTDVFDVRKGALQCLIDYKAKGLIHSVGIATHNVKVVELAAKRDDIDIVFALINKAGRGIMCGSVEDMENAINLCAQNGKGTYLMKVLAGGNLINDFIESVDFARGIEGYHSIAIGMVSTQEVAFNVSYFDGTYDPEKTPTLKGYSKKYRIVNGLCKGCKSCIAACPNYAIEFDEERKKAYIQEEKCLTCGYCTSSCPEFAIRIV